MNRRIGWPAKPPNPTGSPPHAIAPHAITVACERPAQRLAAAHRIGIAAVRNHGAVRQPGKLFCGYDRCLPTRRQPLLMQPLVDLRCARRGNAEGHAEAPDEVPGPLAPAEEAGPMPGRERGHLVQEKQFGPAGFAPRLVAALPVAAHRHAPHIAEFADADDPGLQRPAFFQQRLRFGVMDDAAIAHEQPALRHGVDDAERVDAILQRHRFLQWHGFLPEYVSWPE